MGTAARNPSHKESIMMGFGYRLYPSVLIIIQSPPSLKKRG